MKNIQANKLVFINIRAKMCEYDLLDQTLFIVNANTFEKFQILFDQPLPATKKLRRLLKTKAPWDK